MYPGKPLENLVSSVLLLAGFKDVVEPAGESMCMRRYVAMILHQPGIEREGFVSDLEAVANIECGIGRWLRDELGCSVGDSANLPAAITIVAINWIDVSGEAEEPTAHYVRCNGQSCLLA